LTTDAGTAGSVAINGGSVTTTGAQSYGEAATLGAATTLTSTGSGAITFGNTLNGAQTLAINTSGVTTFQAAVGNTTALSSITTNAGGTLVMNGGSVTTTGTQTYGEAITLGANTTLDAGSADVTLNSSIDGTYGLTVNTTGTTALNGAVGGSVALTSLTTNAGGVVLVNTPTIHTSGAQTYNDIVSLLVGSTLTGSTVTFNDAVIGTADLSVVGAAVLNAG
jgi:hypothetical protein